MDLVEYFAGFPIVEVLDLDTIEEIVWEHVEPIELDNRYDDITIEECHFFKTKFSNCAKEGFQKSGFEYLINYSIELAEPETLIRYYESMPKKYKHLSASQLLQWGTENGLADALPDLTDLAESLRYCYCVNPMVYYLVQSYMLQFKWVRLHKEINGNYVEINEDNL